MCDKKIIVTTGTEHIITATDEERALLRAGETDFVRALMPGISQQDLSIFMRIMPQQANPDWHVPLTEPTLVAVPINVEEDDEDGWIWHINIDHIICKETEDYYGDEPTQAEDDECLNKALKSINKHIDLFKTDNPPTSLPDVAHIIGVTATRRRQSHPPTPHSAAEKAGKGSLSPEEVEYYLEFKRDKKPVHNVGEKEEENANSIKYTPNAFPSATTITGVNPTPATHSHDAPMEGKQESKVTHTKSKSLDNLPIPLTQSGYTSFQTGAFNDGKHTHVYSIYNGKELRTGTIPYRFNNPGDMRPYKGVPQKGALGVSNKTKSGKFSVFPDASTGFDALKHALLTSKRYKGKTLADVIKIYAPPEENDTEKYIADLIASTGLS